ncbi:MAG: PQQ-binding-like beta-propeller repeat protein [Nannocystaceae bacterium]
MRRSHGRGALAAAVLLAACGPAEPAPIVYPTTTDAPRGVLRVDFFSPITALDNTVLRPDEWASVATDPARGLVFAGSRDGTLVALEAESGAFAWEYRFTGALAGEPLPVEIGGEPALLVSTTNGALVALDLKTRQPRWTYETQGELRNRPLVVGDVVYFANTRDQVFALDVRTGTWRWQYEQPFQKDFTVHGRAGLAFIGDHDDESVPEGGMILTGFDSGRVAAIGASAGESLWVVSVAPPEGGNFVDADGTPWIDREAGEVVVTGQATGVHGLALADGAQRWFRPVRGAGSVVGGPGGALVFGSSLEGAFVIERGGRQRWRQQQDPGVLSTPVILNETVVFGHSERGLIAYDLITGELLAQLDLGSGISGQPVYDSVFHRFYAVSNRGVLMAFRVGGEG